MTMLAGTHPIDWFDIPTLDLERAHRFYAAVFDIEMQPFDVGDLRFVFFPMEEGAANATGALVHHPTMYTPSHAGALLYFSVDDIDAVVARVEANGGRLFRGKTAIGEFGFVAFLEDTEGNRVGLHSKT
ncbi:MAG TPA: VOC family protein [Longimicrobiales bacterium]|nr:VOC family protein [Longimicrobiales bacterium]